MTDYTSLEGYSDAKAAHDGAVVAAKAANDELAELRAQLKWRDTVDGFREKAAQIEAREAAVAKAKAEARTKFPHAPEVVYAGLSDPESIAAAAEAAHAAISAAMPAESQAPSRQAPVTGAPWPGPPGGQGANLNPGHKWLDPNEWNKSMEELRASPKLPGQGINNPKAKAMREFALDQLMGNSALKNFTNE